MRAKVNLSIEPKITEEARELGVNMSRVAEAAISDAIKLERNRRWRAENLPEGTLVVDLQTDLIGLEASRIVAPLVEAQSVSSLPKIDVSVHWDSRDWIVRVQQMAAIRGALLKRPIGSVAAARDDLMTAVDVLMRGF